MRFLNQKKTRKTCRKYPRLLAIVGEVFSEELYVPQASLELKKDNFKLKVKVI